MSNTLDDVVLIHTTRPHNLVPQMVSFLGNITKFCVEGDSPLPFLEEDLSEYKKMRRLSFVYISDIPDDKEFEGPLREATELIRHYRLDEYVSLVFLSLDVQERLLTEMAIKVSKKTGQSVERCKGIFRDWKMEKFGGMRGAQNKSVVLADYLNRDVESPIIYHKLDDDIFAYVATFDGESLKITQGYNIFAHKAKKIAETHGIIASRYCIDTPSPLADLNEALRDIEMFLRDVSKTKIKGDSCWSETARKLFSIPTKYVDDSARVEFNLRMGMTYRGAFETMNTLVEMLIKGNNRFCLNTLENLNANYYGFRDCAPGGFVSFSSKLDIRPNIRGANQDLIFTAFEHALGNKVYGDWPVGHIKSLSNRDALLQALTYDPARVGTRINDFGTTYHILRLAIDEGIKLSEGLDPSASVFGWGLRLISLDSIKKNMRLIRSYICSLKQANDKDVLRLLMPFDNFLLMVEDSIPDIDVLYDFDHQPMEVKSAAKELFGLWKEDKEIFYQFRRCAKNG